MGFEAVRNARLAPNGTSKRRAISLPSPFDVWPTTKEKIDSYQAFAGKKLPFYFHSKFEKSGFTIVYLSEECAYKSSRAGVCKRKREKKGNPHATQTECDAADCEWIDYHWRGGWVMFNYSGNPVYYTEHKKINSDVKWVAPPNTSEKSEIAWKWYAIRRTRKSSLTK